MLLEHWHHLGWFTPQKRGFAAHFPVLRSHPLSKEREILLEKYLRDAFDKFRDSNLHFQN